MLSRKNTEELLSSVVFLISCMERVEDRLRLVEGRLRQIEADHERLTRAGIRMKPAAAGEAAVAPAPVRAAASPPDAVQRVAVVVPVYNAPADVERCLAAFFENAGYARLIVVDDGSDAETARLLDATSRRRDFTLIRNPKNLGYTRSINIGAKAAGDADAVIILNSDTIVTVGWVDRIKAAFDASPKVGIVGVWSNAASYQSLPAVKDGSGRFAVNALADGITPDDVAIALGGLTPRYPRVPIVNGFCFAVRGSLFQTIGRFDEEAFPIGYGEENDFCIRAANAGFEFVIADDAYVFHAKSKSFGTARRNALAEAGRKALNRKHGAERMKRVVADLEASPALEEARALGRDRMARAAPDSLFAAFRDRVAYVLPAKPGGGGVHSIVQEATCMARHGVKATVFVPAAEMAAFVAFYGDWVRDVVAPYRNLSHLVQQLKPYSIVVATVYRSVPLVEDIMRAGDARVFYYVQDYEPLFHPEGSPEYMAALATYDTDGACTLFAKTRWLKEIVGERHGRDVRLVLPSLDHDTFYPAKRPRRWNRVTAMVRPSTPRRSPHETVALAKRLATRRGSKLTVSLFGCDPEDPVFDPVRGLARVECLGRLKREEVAEVLRHSDVFVDLSTYQAFGRTSIEGMACGTVPIVPEKGGSFEFAVPGENAFAVDVADPKHIDACSDKIGSIYADLAGFRARAIETAARYTVKSATVSILKTFTQS